MSQKKEVTPLRFENYLTFIRNSVGANLWRNFYAMVEGERKDILRDGWLSCAFYVSSVLKMCGYIQAVHTTVDSTVKDLVKFGWEEISEPIPGSVVVWAPGENTNGHKHIGFYVGNGLAISNDSFKKCPMEGDWQFKGKRKVEKILRNPGLDPTS